MAGWIAQNWFSVLSSAGIVGSLLFTAVSLRSATKTQRISNLLQLTQNHREMWSHVLYIRELNRVFDATVDLSRNGITREESVFVTIVIQHLNSAFQVIQGGLVIKPDGMRRDVSRFFSLPIPGVVWENLKALQDDDFVDFVEKCLNSK